jgi:hypothetical protein
VLRADVEAMVEAIAGALVSMFGADIKSLLLKGSAVKKWDSPIDYVPELSDVDIHYRFTSDEASLASADLDTALSLHADIARRFAKARPEPAHIPRPQLVPADEVEAIPDYVPPPVSTVRVLHGEPPSSWQVEQAELSKGDARRLIEAADPGVLRKAVMDLMERPGWHMFPALRSLNWRVSPSAARTLSMLGVPYEVAWSANRTEAVRLLRAHGQSDLADYYKGYYENGWQFFLSRWTDDAAGRAAFASAIRALRMSAELATLRSG